VSSTLPIRVLGFLVGAFFIVGAISYNNTVSDVSHRLSTDRLFLYILMTSIAALPLIVPWRLIKPSFLWWLLFMILCFDFTAMFYKWVRDTIWALNNKESAQPIVVFLMGFLVVSVVGMQIPAVLHLRRRFTLIP
jgi:hypothetical protein